MSPRHGWLLIKTASKRNRGDRLTRLQDPKLRRAHGVRACRQAATWLQRDDPPGPWNFSASGRAQTAWRRRSCSGRRRAASTAGKGCRSRQRRAARVRVCRGMRGSSAHGSSAHGSSLREAARDEAHLHADSLPQPHQQPATPGDDGGRGGSAAHRERFCCTGSGRIRENRCEEDFFSTSTRARPCWVAPTMHRCSREAVTRRHHSVSGLWSYVITGFPVTKIKQRGFFYRSTDPETATNQAFSCQNVLRNKVIRNLKV